MKSWSAPRSGVGAGRGRPRSGGGRRSYAASLARSAARVARSSAISATRAQSERGGRGAVSTPASRACALPRANVSVVLAVMRVAISALATPSCASKASIRLTVDRASPRGRGVKGSGESPPALKYRPPRIRDRGELDAVRSKSRRATGLVSGVYVGANAHTTTDLTTGFNEPRDPGGKGFPVGYTTEFLETNLDGS